MVGEASLGGFHPVLVQSLNNLFNLSQFDMMRVCVCNAVQHNGAVSCLFGGEVLYRCAALYALSEKKKQEASVGQCEANRRFLHTVKKKFSFYFFRVGF